MPPKELVQDLSNGLKDGFGHVDVSSLLVNLLINHNGNLLHAVLLGSVKLESLSSSCVVVEDLFKSSTNVDRLWWLVTLTLSTLAKTYVNGIELLLHVVGSEEVSDTSKLQQQVILETEDGRRADNSGLREKLSGNLLSSTLARLLAFPSIDQADDLQTFVR